MIEKDVHDAARDGKVTIGVMIALIVLALCTLLIYVLPFDKLPWFIPWPIMLFVLVTSVYIVIKITKDFKKELRIYAIAFFIALAAAPFSWIVITTIPTLSTERAASIVACIIRVLLFIASTFSVGWGIPLIKWFNRRRSRNGGYRHVSQEIGKEDYLQIVKLISLLILFIFFIIIFVFSGEHNIQNVVELFKKLSIF